MPYAIASSPELTPKLIQAAPVRIHPITLNMIHRLARCICRRNTHHCGTLRNRPNTASADPYPHTQCKLQRVTMMA